MNKSAVVTVKRIVVIVYNDLLWYSRRMIQTVIFSIVSFAISLISMPVIIAICKKKNLYDYQDARKIHSGNIPRLGGVGIFAAFLISGVIYTFVYENVSFLHILPIMAGAFIIFGFGIADDILNLPAIAKLIAQMCAALIVTVTGSRFMQLFGWVLPWPISYILTFGWIIGVVNAYNLIDGLDGLCGSLSITAVITLGVLYTVSGSSEGGLCFILACAILGFLCFNWPPAKIFMGDAGSQFLGFMIAVFPLYTSSDAFEFNKLLIMIILASFPIFDTIAAIWRRLRVHRSIMSPDKAHLHHKFLNLGYSKTATLYVILFFQILLCASVIISFFLTPKIGTILLMISFVFMCTFFAVIHYTNRAVLRQNAANKEAVKKENTTESKTEETSE